MRILNKMGAVVIVFLVLAALLIQASHAATLKASAEDFVLGFLGDVIGLDLTRYDITKTSYSYTFPPYFGGIVKEENVALGLNSDKGDLSLMGTFVKVLSGCWSYMVRRMVR